MQPGDSAPAGHDPPLGLETFSGLRAALAVAAPTPMLLWEYAHTAQSSALLIVAIVAAASLVSGATALDSHVSLGRWATLAGVCGGLAQQIDRMLASPALCLALLLGGTLALRALWRREPVAAFYVPADQRVRARPGSSSALVRGAALTAASIWWLFADSDPSHLMAPGALVTTIGLAVVLILARLWRAHGEHPRRAMLLGTLLLLSAAAATFTRAADGFQLHWPVLALLVCAAAAPRSAAEAGPPGWWEAITGHPARLLVGTFVALCFGGMLLLLMPVSRAVDAPTPTIDALFTAVSAVCVTGLVTLDTPTQWSAAGQVVLVLLMQCGGLGIMTFSTVALSLLGRRVSLRHEGALAGLLSPLDRGHVYAATRRLVAFTFAAELSGAALLFWRFLTHGDGPGEALWRAVFTAVSAFCNAGFALQSDSLVRYQTDPWILHGVALLIIMGGLSPAVVLGLAGATRARLSAQARLVWITTLFLLVAGFAFILAAEWNNGLAGLGVIDRLHNAWFQSVTLRTAGFNSIALEHLRPATVVVMMIWMFIGGSPGGTAGGIKTTTLGVLALAVVSAVRGKWNVEVGGRRISHRTVYKAAAIASLGALSVFLASLALLLTQSVAPRDAIYEVVSALGTVGLTLGATFHLDGIGKVIIMACMFAGRVGPLTLFVFLSQRRATTPWLLPEEEVEVG